MPVRIQLRDGPRRGETITVNEVVIDDYITLEDGDATVVCQVRRQCPEALDYIAVYVAHVLPDDRSLPS